MVKRIQILFLVGLFLSMSLLFPNEIKVRVAVSRAPIYAEAHPSSYKIETVRRGTILTLFGSKQSTEGWLYVNYQSPRWKSRVTGFIQAELVEEISSENIPTQKIQERKPEEKPREKSQEKQEIIPDEKKAESKPENLEVEEHPVRVERFLGLTVLPECVALTFPLSFSVGNNPRSFEPRMPDEPVVTTEEVVVPEKTEVPKTEREIKESDQTEEEKRTPEEEKQAISQEPSKLPQLVSPKKEPIFTLSLGYGPSLGGFGGFLQINTAASLSIHWGVGYYPTSMFYPEFDWVQGKLLYSVGIKYYLPWRTDVVRPYIDLQYGGLSVEAVRVVTGIWFYTYVYEDIQKTLWGPSLLAGLELRLGSFGLNGALGMSYVVTDWEYWDQRMFLSADVGFLFYF